MLTVRLPQLSPLHQFPINRRFNFEGFSLSRIVALSLLLLIKANGQEVSGRPSHAVGAVSGSVLTSDGRAASQYLVDIIGTSPTSTGRDRVETDDQGDFIFRNLKIGTYAIVPYLEGKYSRYPAGASSFYDPEPVRVELTDSEANKRVEIHLGPPNRILSGVVRSSADGSPVAAEVQIEFRTNSDRFIRFSAADDGTFRVLIPAKARLLLKATAPGFLAESQILGPVAEDIDPELSIKLKPSRP